MKVKIVPFRLYKLNNWIKCISSLAETDIIYQLQRLYVQSTRILDKPTLASF